MRNRVFSRSCHSQAWMVLRWAAAAFLMTEKSFRRIQGYRDLWMLKAALEEKQFSVREQAA